jgi:hypothetical protein
MFFCFLELPRASFGGGEKALSIRNIIIIIRTYTCFLGWTMNLIDYNYDLHIYFWLDK